MRAEDDQQLPIDSDLDVDERTEDSSRPVHLRWRYLGLVVIGGTIGTAAREAVTLALPNENEIPIAIFGINILGAFLLGVLLEALVRGGPDQGSRRSLRLILGTGVLGGFTTYSALATDTALLLTGTQPLLGICYGLGTVILGAVATAAGIIAAASRPRQSRRIHTTGTRA